MNQYPKEKPKPGEPRPPCCLTCVHWWPLAEGDGDCGVAVGTARVTAPDDWCREHRPRDLRGVAVRDRSW